MLVRTGISCSRNIDSTTVNTYSNAVNTHSNKMNKSVHGFIGMGVHDKIGITVHGSGMGVHDKIGMGVHATLEYSVIIN